ncbi:MAG: hypothetical protein IPL78_05185 [Chloroflexi bacterium]|nr:hypothetical protein [Chloroflexota bacterium]
MLRRNWLFLLLILFLVACQQDNNGTTTTPDAAATPVTTATPTRPQATPTRSATPTPTPEPQPGVIISDQTVDDSGRVLVESVTSLVPAVLALYTDEAGDPADFLAFVSVAAGTTTEVALTLNPLQATPTLHIRLYADEDADNIPDDLDEPLAEASIVVSLEATLPSLTVGDQAVNEAGQLRLDAAAVPGPAWVVIHNDNDGELGDIVGFYPLSPATTYPLTMTIRWHEALPQLQAVLYQDAGERGRFEPGTDSPLLVQGQSINIPFRVTLLPDVTVLDQPVINNQIVIERVISNGPGWLVVYADDGGRPGLIIGFTPLEDGLNLAVPVALNRNALTDTLYIWLHEDTDDIGLFEFPVADEVVRVDERIPDPFFLRTNINNYLIARDQPFDEGQVVVTNVVIRGPGWVVIHNDANGELGDIIGQTWVPAGVSREVVVEIDLDGLTTTLHVAIYSDQGEAESFNIADDLPFRFSGRVISVPIFLTD